MHCRPAGSIAKLGKRPAESVTNDLLFSNFDQLRPSVEPLPVAREAGDDMKMEVEEV